jgi:tetratricopeptide (TPR) repeat protein
MKLAFQRGGLHVVLLILGALTLFAAADKTAWTIHQTPHFELLTDGDDAGAQRTLERLERYRAAMTALQRTGLVSQLPTRVCLLESATTFQRMRQLNQAAAVFQATPTENLLLISAPEERRSDGRTTLHEYTHLLFRRFLSDWPLWLNEGVAEAYSTVRFQGDKATFGIPIPDHVQLLGRRPWVPLDELFSQGSQQQANWSREAGWLFYAQSWLVANYFYFDARRIRDPATQEFLRLISTGTPTTAALKEALHVNEHQLFDQLKAFFHQGSYGTIDLTVPPLAPTATRPARRAARPGEALSWLGDWCVGSTNQLAAAEQFYRQSLEEAPGNSWGTLGLGRLELRRGNLAEAERLIREAVRLDPKNPWTHFWLGEVLTQSAGVSGNERIPEPALAAYREATQLGPNVAPFWAALGKALVRNRDWTLESQKALRRAWELDPGDLWLMLENANALLQHGRKIAAVEMMDQVIRAAGTTKVGLAASRMKQALSGL